MTEEIQRALDNLRFDRTVKGFCLVAPDNTLYASTLDPDTEQMVRQTVSLYKGKISQLTVNTDKGLVVLARIANDWLLAVLFPTGLTLGIAMVKTKATILALREVNLDLLRTAAPTAQPTPPPEQPAPSEPAPPPTPAPDQQPSAPPTPSTPPPAPAVPSAEHPPSPPTPPAPSTPPPSSAPSTPAPTPAETPATEPPRISLSFVPRGGEALLAALDTGSPIGSMLFEKFGPYARDVLFLVDGKRDIKTIAFTLGLPEYAIIEVVEFAIRHKILA